jgi:hypothetical protein
MTEAEWLAYPVAMGWFLLAPGLASIEHSLWRDRVKVS